MTAMAASSLPSLDAEDEGGLLRRAFMAPCMICSERLICCPLVLSCCWLGPGVLGGFWLFLASGRTDCPFEVEGQLFEDLWINVFNKLNRLSAIENKFEWGCTYLETITPPQSFDLSCSTSAMALARSWLSALGRSVPGNKWNLTEKKIHFFASHHPNFLRDSFGE